MASFFFLGCKKEDSKPKEEKKTVFYRVKQVDLDGTVSYSKIVTVKE